MSGTIAVLLNPEAVIGPYKNSQNSLKIFQLSRKTPAAACRSRDIMAQISGVVALDGIHARWAKDKRSGCFM